MRVRIKQIIKKFVQPQAEDSEAYLELIKRFKESIQEDIKGSTFILWDLMIGSQEIKLQQVLNEAICSLSEMTSRQIRSVSIDSLSTAACLESEDDSEAEERLEYSAVIRSILKNLIQSLNRENHQTKLIELICEEELTREESFETFSYLSERLNPPQRFGFFKAAGVTETDIKAWDNHDFMLMNIADR